MTLETPVLTRLPLRMERIADRLDKLEVQVRGLVGGADALSRPECMPKGAAPFRFLRELRFLWTSPT
jgi:hypothetical protein